MMQPILEPASRSNAYVFSGQMAGLLVSGIKYDDSNMMAVYGVFDQKYLGNQVSEQ